MLAVAANQLPESESLWWSGSHWPASRPLRARRQRQQKERRTETMALLVALPLLLLALVCGSAVGYALLLVFLHRKFSGVPGPPRSSFISGHLSQLLRAREEGKTRELLILEWHKQYGYACVLFVFHINFVSCIDPKIINLVLLQYPRTFPKSRYYDILAYTFGERSLGQGLATERDYEKWACQRTILNAAFHRKSLTGLVTEFNKFGDELANVLLPAANTGRFFDMSKHFHRATQDILSQVAFGVCAHSMSGGSKLPTAVQGLVEGLDAAMNCAFPNWSPFVRKERNAYKKNLSLIRNLARDVIQSRLEKLKRNEELPDDILSIMLRAHVVDPTFTTEVIFDNMITFYVAGQETSASTLSLMFMELGKHPHILTRMRQEIDDCIGGKDFITYDDVCTMKYITMVIRETLRMYSIVPGTTRELPQPLLCGKVVLPAGTTLQLSMFASSRHPDFFRNPDTFDPERFDGQDENKIPPTSYFPFSLGPRSCIGQNFAMIEMKILIAKILQRYDCKMDALQSFELAQLGSLKPAHGVWVAINSR